MREYFMKKIFLILIISLFFSSNSIAGPDGKGSLQLSESAVDNFIAYIKGDTSSKGKSTRNKPLVFWVSEDGAHVAWWYCPYAQCTASAGGAEKRQCEKGTAVECSRFARGRYVRWDNGINPKGSKAKFKSSMTVNEIKSKLTSLGFYNNDKTSSNSSTNTKKTKSVIDNLDNLTIDQQLEKLSELFKSGMLTEEEFLSAKKKILN